MIKKSLKKKTSERYRHRRRRRSEEEEEDVEPDAAADPESDAETYAGDPSLSFNRQILGPILELSADQLKPSSSQPPWPRREASRAPERRPTPDEYRRRSIHALLHETFEGIRCDFPRDEKRRWVEMKVTKPAEFKCQRSWVFTCQPADHELPYFRDDLTGEWRDPKGVFASPKIGLLKRIDDDDDNDDYDARLPFIACIRYSTR